MTVIVLTCGAFRGITVLPNDIIECSWQSVSDDEAKPIKIQSVLDNGVINKENLIQQSYQDRAYQMKERINMDE